MFGRPVVFAAVLAAGLVALAAPPASAGTSGYNDWSCKPSSAHPQPLVLIHGLGGTAEENWSYLGPYLAGAGYCAFATTYGQAYPGAPFGGTTAVDASARSLGAFIDRVRLATRARKVDLVGHSEGAFLSLYIPKVLRYWRKVARVVALAPPTHGTTFGGLVTIGDLLGMHATYRQLLSQYGCQACDDLIVGGSAVARLDAGRIAQRRVKYTIIASRFDALVTPHETSFVRERGVRNMFVQDKCPLDPVGHIGLAYDADVAQMVTAALDPRHAAPIGCSFGPPG